jgi:hypothetical protein
VPVAVLELVQAAVQVLALVLGLAAALGPAVVREPAAVLELAPEAVPVRGLALVQPPRS